MSIGGETSISRLAWGPSLGFSFRRRTRPAQIDHRDRGGHREVSAGLSDSGNRIPFSVISVSSSSSVSDPFLAGHLDAEALRAKAAGVHRPKDCRGVSETRPYRKPSAFIGGPIS
jgi:hypothetical protein